MLFLPSRIYALLTAGVIVTGCSGGVTTFNASDGGGNSSGRSSGGSSGSGTSSSGGTGSSSGGGSGSSSGGGGGSSGGSGTSSSGGTGSSSGGGSGSSGGSGGDGGRCTTSADCRTAQYCAFKIADGCSATGTCFDALAPGGPQCQLYAAGCACDGTAVNVACGSPSGYAPVPVLHTGPCTSPVDAGSCTSDGDCPSSEMCAFKIADGCSAVGRCLARPAPGPTCNAYSPACTCSNQEINVICTMYPSGYASQPVAHTGACVTLDAGPASFACGSAGTTCPSTQVCKIGMGGAAGTPPSYTCVDYPAQCASMHTCACVKTAVGAAQCSESGGNVTTTFLYPSAN
jgi:hypothetical protein